VAARRDSSRDGSSGSPRRQRGLYMISVAAELAGMHPQTLRLYENRGLVSPERSSGNTRLYSDRDLERLQRIQELTSELGMNLAGVEKVFELEKELERMGARMRDLEKRAQAAQRELEEEIERVRKSFKRELVRYEPPGSALIPASDAKGSRVRIRISRSGPGRRSPSA